MTITEFAYTLYQSPLSEWLRVTMWIVPTLQSLHILSVAVLAGSVIVTDLRLIGVIATDQSRRSVARHHLPWFWGALACLVSTGVFQVLAEPTRELVNPLFWTKMGLVVFGVAVTLLLRVPVMQSNEDGDREGGLAVLIKPLACLSLLIWTAIVICGRWIAYWV